MSSLYYFRRAVALARTRLFWGVRFGRLGHRCTLGRCRTVRNPRAMEIDKHTTILENWSLVDLKPNCPHSGPRIRIGAYCTILHDFQCNAAQSVEIHDHVLIAPRVFITDSDHVVSSNTASARSWTEFKSARVVIEAGCWLGVNCVILKGVRIGHHSIVGANAVITKNVPPWSTVVGIPGHVVEHRMRPDYPPENLIPSLNNP